MVSTLASRTVLMPDGVEKFLKDSVPITDVTLASLIAAAEPLAHAKEIDQFYRWNGAVWVEVHENDIAAQVVNVAIAQWIKDIQGESTVLHLSCTGSGHSNACVAASNAVKNMKKYLGSGSISNLIRALKRDASVSKSLEDFDTQAYRINFSNGIYDAITGDFLVARPEDCMTKIVNSQLWPGATHPDWDKALACLDMMEPATRKWVQMYLGTALLGVRLKENLTTFFVGNGGNGKNTLLDSIVSVLGSYASQVPESTITGSEQEAAIARMVFKGLRFAFLDETAAGARLDTNATKTISGVTITARKLHVGNVTFKATHTFLIATNHEPYVSEMDEGIWRRLVKVPFKRTFKPTDPDFDPDLTNRLIEGRDGRAEAITAWLLEGVEMFIKGGERLLPLPPELVAETEEWASEGDIIGDWVRDRVIITGVYTDQISNNDLFMDFMDWCGTHGHAVDWKQTGFIRRFKSHRKVMSSGLPIETTKVRGDRKFTGLKYEF